MLIPRNGYASSNVVFENEFSNSGKRVVLKGDKPGYIECTCSNVIPKTRLFTNLATVEIHNKAREELRVVESDCVRYMMMMAQTGQSCYGNNNRDTRGGTYRVDDHSSTYQAFPKAGNPA